MSSETTSLLREPVSAGRRASPSASPSLRTVQVEDHRPGRPTTFSLLASGSASRDASQERKPRACGYDSTAQSHAHLVNGHVQLQVAMPHQAPHSPQTTPYRYGDGKEGYTVRFPSGPADAAEQAASDAAAARIQRHVSYAISLSLLVNIVLFLTKSYSAFVSGSLAVAAAAVDSFLDLASQLIVFLAERGSKTQHEDYPAGRSRLEPVGIIICAALMGCAALQLILESGEQLYVGYKGDPNDHPQVDFTFFTLALLVSTILAKLALWIYCAAFANHSPTLFTLSADHRNDVLSNAVALVAALIAWRWSEAWSADPIGAILMSIYIVWNWTSIALEQIDHIVGKAADPEFLAGVRDLSANFHPQLIPDIIRAYHFGARYLVELEVILPAEMSVREAHDISLSLQQSVEQLEDVERAFVHVDWRGRDEDEHDYQRIASQSKLQAGAKQAAEALTGAQ